jgi:hypothetical protein
MRVVDATDNATNDAKPRLMTCVYIITIFAPFFEKL